MSDTNIPNISEKKENLIIGLPEGDKMCLQKANALIKIWSSDLSLGELKLLDIYLGRINMKEPERKHLRFSKRELENLLQVTRIKPDRLNEMLKHLFASFVNVDFYDEISNCMITVQMHLFDTCTMITNKTTGEMEVDLECSEKASKFIFNVERLGYTKFSLIPALRIKSRYGYTLYQYLLQNAFRKTWTAPIEEVKAVVRCPGGGENDYYDSYKYFNRDILQKCHKEITKLTGLSFSYTPVKTGRRVVAICFTILNPEALKKINALEIETVINEPGQITESTDHGPALPDHYRNHIAFLQSACTSIGREPDFSFEETEAISSVIDRVPDILLPYVPGMPLENREIRQYHYLRDKYLLMKAKDTQKKIGHKRDYIIRMIENDLKDLMSE